jgi:hypothetical protein
MIAPKKGDREAVLDREDALLKLGEAQLKAGQLAQARSTADLALAAEREIPKLRTSARIW